MLMLNYSTSSALVIKVIPIGGENDGFFSDEDWSGN